MEFAMKVRGEYLDALGKVHGEAFKARATVEHRGATEFAVHLPNEEHPHLVDIGRLELMTERLLEQAK